MSGVHFRLLQPVTSLRMAYDATGVLALAVISRGHVIDTRDRQPIKRRPVTGSGLDTRNFMNERHAVNITATTQWRHRSAGGP